MEWKTIDSAPKDREILGLHSDGSESPMFWSEKPICMLGPTNGSFPPGWATGISGESETNLPLRDLIKWKEL